MRTSKLTGKLADRSKARMTPGVVLPRVKEQMLREFEAGQDRRRDVIHPSAVAHQDRFCPRAQYLCITEGYIEQDKFDFVRQNIFATGNAIHEVWQDRIRRSFDLWGDWRCMLCGEMVRNSLEPGHDCTACFNPDAGWEYREVTLDAYDECLLVGHADGAHDTTIDEIKSIGTGTVRIEAPELYRSADGDLAKMWSGISRPFKTHLNQVDIYLWIARARGLPFTRASFIYESKWNQQVKEFVVEYSEERSLKLIDQARFVKYCIDNKEMPECRFPGTCAECKPYDARADRPAKRTVQVRAKEEA